MAGTSEIRDILGNPINPIEDNTSIGEDGQTSIDDDKVIVRWADIIPDDDEVLSDGEDENDGDDASQNGSEICSGDDEQSDDEQDSGKDSGISGCSENDGDVVIYRKVKSRTLDDENQQNGALSSKLCSCMLPIDDLSSLNLLNEILHGDIDLGDHECLISNIVRCLNVIFQSSKKVIDPRKIAATDLFFKIRHELLFKLLCKSYNLPYTKSDQPFSRYEIDSNRTPDMLLDVNGLLAIIEVTATSNFERAAQSKGIESVGFESKYKREMDLLQDKGISNVYIPIFFNMGNTSGEFDNGQLSFFESNFQLNRPYKQLLITVMKNLAIITNEIKTNMIVSASILFSQMIEITMDHKQHSFLYTISSQKLPKQNVYREINISSQVYVKVNSYWDRFANLLENSPHTDDQKLSFCLNTNSHRFHLEKNNSGLTRPELHEILSSNDKIKFFKNLYLIMGNVRMLSTESESGVKFYEKKVSKDFERLKFQSISPFVSHEPLHYSKPIFDIIKYNNLARKSVDYNLISNHYDEDYEEKLINSICNMDAETDYSSEDTFFNKFLGGMESDKVNIDECFSEVKKQYISKNTQVEIMPIIINKMKQPFILPISEIFSSDYGQLDYKPIDLISETINFIKNSNPYTVKILENVINSDFKLYSKPKLASQNLRKLMSRRVEISNSMNYLQKEAYKKGTSDKVLKLSKTADPDYKGKFVHLREELRTINKEINSRTKLEGVKNETSFIRLPTKNKGSTLRGLFDLEMEHFRDKKTQSTIEGVGIRSRLEEDFEFDKNIFNNINDSLLLYHGENPDDLIDTQVTNDSRLLTDLKKLALKEYSALIEQVKNSGLGHSAALISRMSHSIMYYSQLPFNSDYVRVDNLGYKNILLMVRGGKKIFKSKSSKMFRLLFPIERSTVPWYTMGHSRQSSTLIFEHKDRTYALTPWQMLHESVLCDSISFYPRICSFVVLNSNPSLGLKEQYHKFSLNVLLAFHNRRQTEVLLANLRYILLSTLGDFTGVTEIIPEFFGFNYDCFQAYIRGCVLFNYPNYFKQLGELKRFNKSFKHKEISLGDFIRLDLKNIFTGLGISKTEDLALMIYSTFLMTKAPYQRSVERANNLKGILKIHELYNETVGKDLEPIDQLDRISVTLDKDYKEYSERLFKNDFNIDPKYCALVGNFIDSIYANQGDTEELHSSWIRIINKTWDELSTSTGLRGEYDKVEDFWGKKGYFVVYKNLLQDEDFRAKAHNLIYGEMSDNEKRKLLKDINITYYEKISPEREFLIFHAVDKVQWRGGREIYVMDLMTKTMQQPIEQFMGELCKKLDNELISIPSDKRSQVIHHSIFEKDLPVKNLLTWYLTLDCTKWAPKSVFVKFAITILNMNTLPTSFKVHFLNYIEKLYNKRVYFNQQEVQVLSNNNKYDTICKNYLKYDEKLKGYYLEMQYSWVMGIFNYTSSFLHAANQKYFSYLLMKSSLLSYKEESTMVMFAHSDDSGGRLTVSDYSMARRALILYEINLKACNHLLSRKKSVVSRIYFEILSIIYLFKQLLALLPKFLGGLRFMPTDKGPAQDMLQSYSKSIEVMVAGANFNIAYLVMKFYSMIIWRFYYNRKVTSDDYERPVQYLGMPDAHPLLVLLCGSDAELLRLLKNKDNIIKQMAFVKTMLRTTRESGPIKPLSFEIKVRGIGKGFEDGLEEFGDIIQSWSVRNVNYHNSLFNLLSFLGKLNDSGFVGSLVNESTTRRLSRCYYMRSGDSCITRLGNIKLSKVLDSLLLFQNFTTKSKGVELIFDEILSNESIDKINNEIEIQIPSIEKQILILEKTLSSPIKINKYLDNLTLENRKITIATRTLKPTVLQLNKTARVFSTDFDPPTLVSYIKEPEMNWAINDTRGLVTAKLEVEEFCNEIGLDLNLIEPDDLLRICRTYGRENTKMIYLYSRVPSELRHIKSYSAFLTFLSVNTFDNREIEGLTLKLTGRDAVRDYVETNINQEVYLINNIISTMNVFLNKVDIEFLMGCTINPLEEIGWEGGKLPDFIRQIENFFKDDIHYCFLKPQLSFIMSKIGISERNALVFAGGAFYTFLKNQKVRGGWFGKGEILLSIENNFYSFTLFNNDVQSVQTNRSGKLPSHHTKFIRDVFNHTNINYNSISKGKKQISVFRKIFFGHDNLNNLTVSPEREIQYGIPCVVTQNRGGFLDELHLYKMSTMFKDHINLRNEVFETEQIKKIYFLPIKKAEMAPIIMRMFDKNEFNEKMLSEGLNDFEDFILTEIMTEYGINNYVGFNEFIDGFTGSKTYEVFKKCREDNISLIPKNTVRSIVPAPEGSMTRILLDYTRVTNDKIIEPPKSLDPTIMQIRSEYPEQNTVILSENLVKYHYKIFSKEEVKEISDSYSKLYEYENSEMVRENIIKLLTFWGYGSLVNSIEKFTFIRDHRNYLYFNKNITSKDYITHYEGLFPRIISCFNKVLFDWESSYKSVDYPYKFLVFKSMNMVEIINNYVMDKCLSIYNYSVFEAEVSLPTLLYFNMLDAFLKEEEFVASVQFEMGKHYILGSLPISYQNRKNIYLLINNLNDCWLKFNNQKFNLNFVNKLQRFPDNITNYRSMVKLFNAKIPPASIHYHGFMNNKILSELKESVEINVGSRIYRITSKISNLSDQTVFANNIIKFKYPLNNKTLEDEEFDELNAELSMEDKDEDTILEIWQLLKNPYKPKVTKTMNVKGNKLIRATVNWVIAPYKSCTYKEINQIRQVGENIVYLSNTYLKDFQGFFPNSGVRLVSYDKNKLMLAHYTFTEDFNKESIVKYIGGEDFSLNDSVTENLSISLLRDIDGKVKKSTNLGFSNIIERSLVNTRYEEVNGVIVPIDDVSNDNENNVGDVEDDVNKIEKEIELKHQKILNELNKLKDLGLGQNSIKRLNEKYFQRCMENKIPFDIIMSSLIREGELNIINEMIINNSLNLTSDQQRSAFLSPDCFGLAYGMNKIEDPKSIKNGKIRAELESFHKELSGGIGSGTIKISDKFRKTVNSNIRLWKNTIKNTKHKRENKMFLLTFFISLLNSNRPTEETDKDYIWQDMVNKSTEYIADEIDETDDDDFLNLMFDFMNSTRLRYLPEGM